MKQTILYLHGLPIPNHVMKSMQNAEQYVSTFKTVEHTFKNEFDVINVKFKHDSPLSAIAVISMNFANNIMLRQSLQIVWVAI